MSDKKNPPVYSVYVIELDKEILKSRKFMKANPHYDKEKGKACLYVGQTTKTPDERLQQHKAGIKAARFVKKHGMHLRRKLYKKYNPLPSREAAEKKERWLAKQLRKKGFAVWWN